DGKVYKDDQIFFGYARLSACPELAEFGYISETELKLLGNKIWKVPKKNWCVCPEIEVVKIAEKQKHSDFEGRNESPSRPSRPLVAPVPANLYLARSRLIMWLSTCMSLSATLSLVEHDNIQIICKEVDKKMDENTQTRIDEYVSLLNRLKEQVGNENALAILQEVKKDERANQIHKERSFSNDLPATENQIAYLRKLGAVIPEGLGRQEASQLIDNAKAARNRATVVKVPVRVP
ncbi:unnamed protein product, partial [marine sediment metagenome]